MSRRNGIQLTVQRSADGGEHPNRFIPAVSAHVRVYWPPLATRQEIEDALNEAHIQALDRIRSMTYEA